MLNSCAAGIGVVNIDNGFGAGIWQAVSTNWEDYDENALFRLLFGISGDMTIGALLDLGVPAEYFLSEIEKLSLGGFTLKFEKIKKNGILVTDFDVIPATTSMTTSMTTGMTTTMSMSMTTTMSLSIPYP
jgi:hypothetical protein